MSRYERSPRRKSRTGVVPGKIKIVVPVLQDARHGKPVLLRAPVLRPKETPTDRWLIIELHEEVSLEQSHEVIARRIQDCMGPGVEYFIPVHSEKVGEKAVSVVLAEGYIFLRESSSTFKSLSAIKDDLIKGPLVNNKRFRHVDTKEIDRYRVELRKKIEGLTPSKGQTVVPRVGIFRNLKGTVLSVDKRTMIARVLFKKPTRVVEAKISIINLQNEMALA